MFRFDFVKVNNKDSEGHQLLRESLEKVSLLPQT